MKKNFKTVIMFLKLLMHVSFVIDYRQQFTFRSKNIFMKSRAGGIPKNVCSESTISVKLRRK